MTAPRYQTLTAASIPVVDGVRVIAGEFRGTKGPAQTFTPVTLLVVELGKGKSVKLELPEGYSSALYVGRGKVNDAAEGELVLLSREGEDFVLEAEKDATVFVMSGEPIDEPVAGYGPFVMNTPQEIQQAFADYHAGRLGQIPTMEKTS
jgi:redox-sensitive bicupin YhaK (pirin superfamily)